MIASGSRTPFKLVHALVAVASLGAVTLAPACSSDPAAGDDAGGGSSTQDSGGGGGGGGGGGFDASIPTAKCAPYTAPAGKGTAKTASGESKDIPEVSCHTLRKRDGSVIGYAASFGRFQPISTTRRVRSQMERMDRFYVKAYGYSGDGEIADATYTIARADGSNNSGGGKLVLSQGGKKGVFTGGVGNADTIEFECDAKDDTAATAGPALTDAPGRAIIERERGGEAYVLEGITCRESAPSSIANFLLTHPYPFLAQPSDGPCVPHETLLEAKVNGPGTYDLDPGSFVVQNLVEVAFVGTSVNGKTQVTLTGANPIKGTFQGSTPGGAGGNNFNGSFTCPNP
jgi:hypothetical protein